MPDRPKSQVPAIKVHQWLKAWDSVDFSETTHRRKPNGFFYLLSLPATELRKLSGIARREASAVTPRAADLGIQRELDVDRTEEIRRFIEFGFPWSTLSKTKRKQPAYKNLRKPGWLPTAILVNILSASDTRKGRKVEPKDLITIDAETNSVQLPYSASDKNWSPKGLPPIEVIDGQHRLWAFDQDGEWGKYEVPIVAFVGLDISWQAYLFWTINIKPKRINASLAFDLFPLLRSEDWLESDEPHSVYRETRSQELTEALWSHPASPWYDRINMLGERGVPWVSQSAWIKSLLATLVRPWEGRGKKLGGLFGSRMNEDGEVLGWTRAQQAAFLILAWDALRLSIEKTNVEWARSLRSIANKGDSKKSSDDPALYGRFSLLVTDQGVRGFLHVLNDLCFTMASRLQLDTWHISGSPAATDEQAVTASLSSLKKHDVGKFLNLISVELSSFDWRTSATPNISEELRRQKLVFRGSSGYKELRVQLLQHLSDNSKDLGDISKRLIARV